MSAKEEVFSSGTSAMSAEKEAGSRGYIGPGRERCGLAVTGGSFLPSLDRPLETVDELRVGDGREAGKPVPADHTSQPVTLLDQTQQVNLPDQSQQVQSSHLSQCALDRPVPGDHTSLQVNLPDHCEQVQSSHLSQCALDRPVPGDHTSLQVNLPDQSQQVHPSHLSQCALGRRHSVDSNIGRSRQPTFVRTYREVKWTRINTPTTRLPAGGDPIAQDENLREYIGGTHIIRRRVPIFIASGDAADVTFRRFSAGDLIPVTEPGLHLTPNEKCLVIRNLLPASGDSQKEGATCRLCSGRSVEANLDLYQFSLIDEGDEDVLDDGSDDEDEEEKTGKPFGSTGNINQSHSPAAGNISAQIVVSTPTDRGEAPTTVIDERHTVEASPRTIVKPPGDVDTPLGYGQAASVTSMTVRMQPVSQTCNVKATSMNAFVSPVSQTCIMKATSKHELVSTGVHHSTLPTTSTLAPSRFQSPLAVVPSLLKQSQVGETGASPEAPHSELSVRKTHERPVSVHSEPCGQPDLGDSSWLRTSTKIAGTNVLVSSYHPHNSAISTTSVHWLSNFKDTIHIAGDNAAAIRVEHITVPAGSADSEPLLFQRVTYPSERICCSARWVSPKEISTRSLGSSLKATASASESVVLSSRSEKCRLKSAHKCANGASHSDISGSPSSLGRDFGVEKVDGRKVASTATSRMCGSLSPVLAAPLAARNRVGGTAAAHGVNGQTTCNGNGQSTHSMNSQATYNANSQTTHNGARQATPHVGPQATHKVNSQTTHNVGRQAAPHVNSQTTHNMGRQAAPHVNSQTTHNMGPQTVEAVSPTLLSGRRSSPTGPLTPASARAVLSDCSGVSRQVTDHAENWPVSMTRRSNHAASVGASATSVGVGARSASVGVGASATFVGAQSASVGVGASATYVDARAASVDARAASVGASATSAGIGTRATSVGKHITTVESEKNNLPVSSARGSATAAHWSGATANVNDIGLTGRRMGTKSTELLLQRATPEALAVHTSPVASNGEQPDCLNVRTSRLATQSGPLALVMSASRELEVCSTPDRQVNESPSSNRQVNESPSSNRQVNESPSSNRQVNGPLSSNRQVNGPLSSNRHLLGDSIMSARPPPPSAPPTEHSSPIPGSDHAKPSSKPRLGSASEDFLSATEDSLVCMMLRSLSTDLENAEAEADNVPCEGSSVAIDNKIEQAMDLVKRHLMYAVREEVEILKQQIGELVERIGQLEYENTVLRSEAKPETLNKLQQTRGTQPSQTSLPGQSSSFTIVPSSQQSGQQATNPMSQAQPSQQYQQTTTPHSVSQAQPSQQYQQTTTPHSVSQAQPSQQYQQTTTPHSVSQAQPSQQHQQTTTPHSVSQAQPSQQTVQTTST